MLLFLLVYEIILVPIFFLFLSFFFFILNKITSCKNKISSSSESDMISKELHNPDFIFYSENLMTDVSRIIVKYRQKIIAKYRQISPFIALWEPSLRYYRCFLYLSSWIFLMLFFLLWKFFIEKF